MFTDMFVKVPSGSTNIIWSTVARTVVDAVRRMLIFIFIVKKGVDVLSFFFVPIPLRDNLIGTYYLYKYIVTQQLYSN